MKLHLFTLNYTYAHHLKSLSLPYHALKVLLENLAVETNNYSSCILHLTKFLL